MKLRFATVAIVCAAAVLFSVPQRGWSADNLIGVGTGSINGVYFPLGGAICRLINAGRRSHGYRCMVEPSAGSISNINAVVAGELELGFAQSDAQYTALKGLGPFNGNPQTKLRALFSVYPESFTVVARQDANIGGIADLRDRRVAIGEPGSATRAAAEMVLNAYGMTPQALKPSSGIKSDELASALCDNRLDAFALIVGHPNATVQAASNACATVIVAISGPAVDQAIKDHPFFGRAGVPARMYKGTEDARASFGVFATVVTNADLADAAAYLVTKAVFDGFEEFRSSHPALANITRDSMLTANTVPFHPGALRYFRERGLIK